VTALPLRSRRWPACIAASRQPCPARHASPSGKPASSPGSLPRLRVGGPPGQAPRRRSADAIKE